MGSLTDWGKMRARGGEEASIEESGDGREGWRVGKAVSIRPKKMDLPGEGPP